jgi:hypothetical protein
MKFPKGKPIYEDTPSALINVKELVAWIHMEKFNGVLEGKVGDITTQILITDGDPRKAFTFTDDTILVQDDEAIETFVTDAMMRVSSISLYVLEDEIIKSLLIRLFINPVLSGDAKIFDSMGMIEKLMERGQIGHIFLDFNTEKLHFLFYDGRYLGYYSEKDGKMRQDEDKINLINYLNSKLGFLMLHIVSLKDFEDLKLPSLRFGEIERNTEFIAEILTSFLNYMVKTYTGVGIYSEKIRKIIEKIYNEHSGIVKDFITMNNGEFLLNGNPNMSWYELVSDFAILIKNINLEISKLWGKKMSDQKYIDVYKDFYERIKSSPEMSQLFSYLNPENLERVGG